MDGNYSSATSSPAIVVGGGEMLIVKRISLPVSLKQHQPCSNQAFLIAHVNLCCVVVGCVLYKTQLSFSE
jgi:hypothetical protein